MFNKEQWTFALFLAIATHVLLALLLLLNIKMPHKSRPVMQAHTSVKPVQAIALDAKTIQAQVKKIKAQRAYEHRAARQLKNKMARQKAQLKAMQRKARLEQQKQLRAKKALAKKLKAMQAKKQAIAKANKAAEKKLKATKAAQKKLAVKKKPEKTEPAFSSQELGELDRYKALILKAIARRWIVPDDAIGQALACTLAIKLSATGKVLSVQLLRSSGNKMLDRSAQAAVYKASPLPMPNTPKLAKAFRDLHLTVKPESLISSA